MLIVFPGGLGFGDGRKPAARISLGREACMKPVTWANKFYTTKTVGVESWGQKDWGRRRQEMLRSPVLTGGRGNLHSKAIPCLPEGHGTTLWPDVLLS